MPRALVDLGIQTKVQDSPTLMITLEDLDDDGTHYVYIRLALGEEELDNEVLESVDFLLSQFAEHFLDDKD